MADARKIVFTGAAGGIGTMTRPLLAEFYPGLVLSDRVKPKDLLPYLRKAPKVAPEPGDEPSAPATAVRTKGGGIKN